MSRRHIVTGAIALLAALVVAAGGAANPSPANGQGAIKCKTVAKGSPWRYSGRHGTLYTIVGNRTTSCAVGVKWLVRLTTTTGVTKTPPGWECIAAVARTGQCETKSGAIFQWINK